LLCYYLLLLLLLSCNIDRMVGHRTRTARALLRTALPLPLAVLLLHPTPHTRTFAVTQPSRHHLVLPSPPLPVGFFSTCHRFQTPPRATSTRCLPATAPVTILPCSRLCYRANLPYACRCLPSPPRCRLRDAALLRDCLYAPRGLHLCPFTACTTAFALPRHHCPRTHA